MKDGEILSKEIIFKIREAETKAEKIKDEASLRAKNMIRDADAAGKKLCETTEASCASENAEKLRKIQEKADELIVKSTQKAEENAKELTSDAELRMREAIRLIIGGVTAQCQ